ncbi:MAG: hypothetical protein WCW26_03745 [Candidatus Buchananbacteria bacterium]
MNFYQKLKIQKRAKQFLIAVLLAFIVTSVMPNLALSLKSDAQKQVALEILQVSPAQAAYESPEEMTSKSATDVGGTTGFFVWATGWVVGVLVKLEGWIITVETKILLFFLKYNGFVTATPVIIGWTLVRDVCNLFFVLILLVIALGTILRVESYNFKKLLPKVLLLAILINFSRTICGFAIDFAQVVMMSFVAAFVKIGTGGNLYAVLHINDILMATGTAFDDGNKAISALAVVVSGILAVFLLLIALIVIFVMMVVIIMRIIMLWMLVVLSPLPYILSAFPQGQRYAQQWWQEFTKYVIVGPILAFFLWLTFAVASQDTKGSITGSQIGIDMTGLKAQLETTAETDPGYTPSGNPQLSNDPFTGIGDVENMLSLIIGIGMLMAGLMVTQQLGVAGSQLAGQAFGASQKILKSPIKAAAWLDRKMYAGEIPLVGKYLGGLSLNPARWAQQYSKWAEHRKQQQLSFGAGLAGTKFAGSFEKKGPLGVASRVVNFARLLAGNPADAMETYGGLRFFPHAYEMVTGRKVKESRRSKALKAELAAGPKAGESDVDWAAREAGLDANIAAGDSSLAALRAEKHAGQKTGESDDEWKIRESKLDSDIEDQRLVVEDLKAEKAAGQRLGETAAEWAERKEKLEESIQEEKKATVPLPYYAAQEWQGLIKEEMGKLPDSMDWGEIEGELEIAINTKNIPRTFALMTKATRDYNDNEVWNWAGYASKTYGGKVWDDSEKAKQGGMKGFFEQVLEKKLGVPQQMSRSFANYLAYMNEDLKHGGTARVIKVKNGLYDWNSREEQAVAISTERFKGNARAGLQNAARLDTGGHEANGQYNMGWEGLLEMAGWAAEIINFTQRKEINKSTLSNWQSDKDTLAFARHLSTKINPKTGEAFINPKVIDAIEHPETLNGSSANGVKATTGVSHGELEDWVKAAKEAAKDFVLPSATGPSPAGASAGGPIPTPAPKKEAYAFDSGIQNQTEERLAQYQAKYGLTQDDFFNDAQTQKDIASGQIYDQRALLRHRDIQARRETESVDQVNFANSAIGLADAPKDSRLLEQGRLGLNFDQEGIQTDFGVRADQTAVVFTSETEAKKIAKDEAVVKAVGLYQKEQQGKYAQHVKQVEEILGKSIADSDEQEIKAAYQQVFEQLDKSGNPDASPARSLVNQWAETEFKAGNKDGRVGEVLSANGQVVGYKYNDENVAAQQQGEAMRQAYSQEQITARADKMKTGLDRAKTFALHNNSAYGSQLEAGFHELGHAEIAKANLTEAQQKEFLKTLTSEQRKKAKEEGTEEFMAQMAGAGSMVGVDEVYRPSYQTKLWAQKAGLKLRGAQVVEEAAPEEAITEEQLAKISNSADKKARRKETWASVKASPANATNWVTSRVSETLGLPARREARREKVKQQELKKEAATNLGIANVQTERERLQQTELEKQQTVQQEVAAKRENSKNADAIADQASKEMTEVEATVMAKRKELAQLNNAAKAAAASTDPKERAWAATYRQKALQVSEELNGLSDPNARKTKESELDDIVHLRDRALENANRAKTPEQKEHFLAIADQNQKKADTIEDELNGLEGKLVKAKQNMTVAVEAKVVGQEEYQQAIDGIKSSSQDLEKILSNVSGSLSLGQLSKVFEDAQAEIKDFNQAAAAAAASADPAEKAWASAFKTKAEQSQVWRDVVGQQIKKKGGKVPTVAVATEEESKEKTSQKVDNQAISQNIANAPTPAAAQAEVEKFIQSLAGNLDEVIEATEKVAGGDKELQEELAEKLGDIASALSSMSQDLGKLPDKLAEQLKKGDFDKKAGEISGVVGQNQGVFDRAADIVHLREMRNLLSQILATLRQNSGKGKTTDFEGKITKEEDNTK